MKQNFIQKNVYFDPEKNNGKIKVEKLCQLISQHPYKEAIFDTFNVNDIKDDVICIDYIDNIYERVKHYNENYNRSSIFAQIKDINVYEEEKRIGDETEKNITFQFEEYVDIDEAKTDLKAIAIYDSKNTYLDEYEMTKYANNLFKIGLSGWANENIKYFKNLAQTNSDYNKHRSYRLVEHEGQIYLRGITSTTNYYEYGVDFTFVVSMLILHINMKANKGIEYRIKSCALNESKLDLIVSEKYKKDAGAFGKVSVAIKISTNDLGQGSLNFSNIINVGHIDENGFYLYPKKSEVENNKLQIYHNTKPGNVLPILNDMDGILNTSDKFIEELNSIKTIKTPDELRIKILGKIENPRSSFKGIRKLADIFSRKIDNEISSFVKLLEMCNKAEELDIEFDLKDKLRYIISDIILYGSTKN